MGDVVLHRVAVPWVQRTGRSPQALARWLLAGSYPLWVFWWVGVMRMVRPFVGGAVDVAVTAALAAGEAWACWTVIASSYAAERCGGDSAVPWDVAAVALWRAAVLAVGVPTTLLLVVAAVGEGRLGVAAAGAVTQVAELVGLWVLTCLVPPGSVPARVKARRGLLPAQGV